MDNFFSYYYKNKKNLPPVNHQFSKGLPWYKLLFDATIALSLLLPCAVRAMKKEVVPKIVKLEKSSHTKFFELLKAASNAPSLETRIVWHGETCYFLPFTYDLNDLIECFEKDVPSTAKYVPSIVAILKAALRINQSERKSTMRELRVMQAQYGNKSGFLIAEDSFKNGVLTEYQLGVVKDKSGKNIQLLELEFKWGNNWYNIEGKLPEDKKTELIQLIQNTYVQKVIRGLFASEKAVTLDAKRIENAKPLFKSNLEQIRPTIKHLIICELKASVNKGQVITLDRKRIENAEPLKLGKKILNALYQNIAIITQN